MVADSAYRSAVEAGDFVLAIRAIRILDATGAAPTDAGIVALADAVARRRPREVEAALERIARGPFAFLVPVVRAWQAQDGGRGDPLALLAAADSPLTRRYAAEAQSLLLIAQRRYDDGVAATQAQMTGAAAPEVRWNAAQLLAGLGQRDRARALLGGTDSGRGVKPSLAFGTARLLTRIAGDLPDQRGGTFTTALLRSAVLLEPGNDRARIALAEVLLADDAEQAAIAVLAKVGAGPFADRAAALRLQAIAAGGDVPATLAAALTAAAAWRADPAAIARLGDYLNEAGRHDDAAAAYARATARSGTAPIALDDLRMGDALAQAGRWDEARPYRARALAAAPDDPQVLNAVGYARLEHGEDVAGSRALLERAASARPDDIAILDSVAYGYLLSGDAPRAVPLLERAAQAERSDPTIMEHLGDAYWAVGRRYEARYAWRAAAMGASGAAAERLAARIADGPSAARLP